MKVLLIGHFREPDTGWGVASRNLALALDRAGVDVVCRSLVLNHYNQNIPERIVELEGKPIQNCDVCIQYVLPHFMSWQSGFKKHIGIYFTETEGIELTSWPDNLNLMDEIWTPCRQMLQNAKNNGITKPCKLLYPAFDIDQYKKEYEPLDNFRDKYGFVFYTIAEFNKRKHLSALIQAFHLEFDIDENVTLLIKTNRSGMNDEQLVSEVQGLSDKIKSHLNIRKRYKNELIIPAYLNVETLYRLHNSCDCFVMPSYGEAWCIPAFEAMAFGKMPICTNTGGMRDFILDGQTGFLVDARKSVVFGNTDTFPEFATANSYWEDIDVEELRSYMRIAFTMSEKDWKLAKVNSQRRIEKFSFESVAKRALEYLNE